jgi:ABC-type methionine transport system ATPase subunit
LRSLHNARYAKGQKHVRVPSNYRPASFAPIRSNRPLIDAIGTEDISTALSLLGVVTLSDAFVYLKRFEELSAGQQYRAMLAKMLCSGSNVWIADEFCVNLDPIAANCVANRLRLLSKKQNAALVVATPQPDVVARSLRPDLVVRLTTAWEYEVISGVEFLGRLRTATQAFRVPSLKVPSATFHRVKRNESDTAILVGKHHVAPGPIVLRTLRQSLATTVLKVDHLRVSRADRLAHSAANGGTKAPTRRAFGRSTSDTSVLTIVRLKNP